MKKMLLPMILAIAMLFSVVCCPGFTEPTMPDAMSVRDYEALSIDAELARSREVFKALKGNAGNKSLAMKYVPEGGVLMDTDSTEHWVYLDYWIGQTRYSVTYYWDGNVEKVSREGSSPYIYIADSTKKEIQVLDMRTRVETFTRSHIRGDGVWKFG